MLNERSVRKEGSHAIEEKSELRGIGQVIESGTGRPLMVGAILKRLSLN